MLGLTSAYRTTSIDALYVLAGVMPLDLEMRWMVAKKEAKLPPQHMITPTLNKIRNDLLDTWKIRWTNSSKGRWTYGCFPCVRTRLNTPITMGHEVAQLITGHGNFRKKLTGFQLQESPQCTCDMEEEDVDHVLCRCRLHNAHRVYLELAAHRSGLAWPCSMSELMSSRGLYTALHTICKEGGIFGADVKKTKAGRIQHSASQSAKPRICSGKCQGVNRQKRFTCGAVLSGHSYVGDAGGADADNSLGQPEAPWWTKAIVSRPHLHVHIVIVYYGRWILCINLVVPYLFYDCFSFWKGTVSY